MSYSEVKLFPRYLSPLTMHADTSSLSLTLTDLKGFSNHIY